jgi:arsenate reductase (thioredoxin)
MAAGFLQHLAGDQIEVLSAGSEPAEHVNPVSVEAMAEKGIDISGNQPELLENSTVAQADVVITMGCGDACPFYPGKRYEDWELEDPAGKSLEQVRLIRDEIQRRVRRLIAGLPTVEEARPPKPGRWQAGGPPSPSASARSARRPGPARSRPRPPLADSS